MFTASKHHTRMARAAGVALAVTIGAGTASRASAQGVVSGASLDSLLNVRVEAASRYEQDTRWAPASLTIVTRDEIESRGYTTLAEVLQDVPGFYTTYDRDYTYVGVRGFSRPTDWNNRVLVLLNGHALNEGVYHSTPTGTELAQNIRGLERIEIVRGPGSALYGTSAMFAVINLVTRNGDDLGGGEVVAEAGSFGSRSISVTAGTRLGSHVDVAVTASQGRADGQDLYFPEFDDPQKNNGVAVGLDWDEFKRITAVASLGGLALTARHSVREKGLPTASWGGAFNDPRTRTEATWSGLHLRHESRPTTTTALTLTAAYDEYSFHGVFPGEGYVYENATDANAARVGAQLDWDVSPAYRLTAGSELTRYLRADYRDWTEFGTYGDDDFPYTVKSAYAQLEAQLTSRLALTTGVRHDDYTTAGTATTPRVALVATPDERSVLKLLWGRAFRAPNVYEQFVVTASRDRPQLEPETIDTWELAAERRLSQTLLAQGSLYRYHVEDLIDRQDDPTGGDAWYENRSQANAVGGEIGLLLRTENVRANVSYGRGEARDHDSNVRLSNSPAHLIKASATAQFPAGFESTWTQRFESGRLTVQGTETDAFTLGTLTLRKPNVYKGAGLSLQVRNVFDATYATPAGFEHRQVTLPQDGRTFALRIEWSF